MDKLTGYEVQKRVAEIAPFGRERTEARLWVSIVEGGFTTLNDEDRLILDLCYIHKAKRDIDQL